VPTVRAGPDGPGLTCAGRARTTSRGDPRVPARHVDGGHRRERERASRRWCFRALERALAARLLDRAGEAPVGLRHGRGRRSTSTRSCASTSGRSGARRGPTRRPTPAPWTTSATCSPPLPESPGAGYKKGRFSFNVAGGRCEECEGAGVKVEMQFLPTSRCRARPAAGGASTLRPLRCAGGAHDRRGARPDASAEAAALFRNRRSSRGCCDTLVEVGLGYLKLGAAEHDLSGGEAQRVKLADRAAPAVDRPHAVPAR
jgi:hypothetical protein